MKTVAILSALVSVVAAQTSSFIPTSGASDTCKAYLAQLDGNTSLKSCTSALAGATSAFSSSSGGGSAAVSSSLSNLCASNIDNACSSTNIGKAIAELYAACQSEIAGNNDQVKTIYELLYLISPMRKALCTKDDSGRSCATQVPKSNGLVAGGMTPSDAQKYIASTNGAVPTLNATTFTNQNVPFLFISPDSDASVLCTSCTRQIFTSYSDWETQVPYAPGISQSKLLQSQNNVYSAIKSKCPSNFLSSSGVQAAGAAGKGIGSGLLNGAERTASGAASALIGGALLAVVSMAL